MPSRIGQYIKRTLAALFAGAVLAAAPAVAQQVGTAAAVNPLSESTPPAGQSRVLQIGARIVHKERIKTTATGTVQLLFVDKTTLSIGPNSNLVIDKFVYDPAAGTGQMVTSLTKGGASVYRWATQPPGRSDRQNACCNDRNSRRDRHH